MLPCSDEVGVAGDAHYTYRNAADFQVYGNLEVHNRKELLSWLDKIIEGTQKAHNFHLVSDDEDVLSASVAVMPGSPVKLPTYITTRSAACVVQMCVLTSCRGSQYLCIAYHICIPSMWLRQIRIGIPSNQAHMPNWRENIVPTEGLPHH